jgi:hypothetical protein
VSFIELTETERIRLLQVYIAALAAFITGSAMIIAYGYGKIEITLLLIPLTAISAFLALLSIILYLIFLRWDATYAYNTAQLDWISEKLGLVRRMPDDKVKMLRSRYEELNRKYGRFPWMILLPKRDEPPEWALIDEAYGPLVPPSSIRAHPWFNRFLLICVGSSLTLSISLASYAVFNRPMDMVILSGILILFGVLYILFKYDEKLRNKVEDEANLFKELRKPKDVKASGLEQTPKPSGKYEEYKRLILVLDLVIVISFFSIAITYLQGWVEFSYTEVLLILAIGLISTIGSRAVILLLSRQKEVPISGV